MKSIIIYSKNIWKLKLVYKWELIVYILANMFNVAAMLFIWYVVYKSSNNSSIDGYNFNSIMLYTIMANLTAIIINTDIASSIATDIQKGDITNSFIRPVPYMWKLTGEALGDISFNIFVFFMPMIIILIIGSSIYNIEYNLKYISIFLYILSVIFSIYINFQINVLVGFCAFYVNYIWGFLMLKHAIIMIVSGQLFPISFYPDKVIQILKLTPFYYINYGPVSILLNKFSDKETFEVLLIQFVWCILLYFASKYVLKKSEARLQVNGG